MVNTSILWNDVVRMINHWAATPENGYLGSDYGGGTVLNQYLNASSLEDNSKTLIKKLKKDVPYLEGLDVSVVLTNASCIQISVGSDSTIILMKSSRV